MDSDQGPLLTRAGQPPSLLHVQLLGEFRLMYGGTPVTTVNSPRLQALLTYLLLHRSAPQPRYHLAFLLWPDSPESQAHTNLRNLLHRLRHALPDAEHFLEEDHRTLQWRSDSPLALDVSDFENAFAQACRAEKEGDSTAQQSALEQAANVYNGELLPSCYDEWILPYRERLHQALLEALEKLILLLESQRRYRPAIGYAQRLLRYDPLDEATYRHLMRLHAATGDRTGALRVYHTCTAVLKRELDVEPEIATSKEYKRILAAEAQTPGQPEVSETGNLPTQLTTFIGRKTELAEVKQLLSTTRLLTLTGAPGSGKTRLGLEVAAQLAQDKKKFPDGTWWIELDQLNDPSLVPQAVAEALSVREKPGEELTQTLREELRGRVLLLLLDGCEHLIEACSSLAATLLRACPRLQVLATSREALGLMGETAWPVPPLSFPSMGGDKKNKEVNLETGSDGEANVITAIRQYESVALFLERAAITLPTFRLTERNAEAVLHICSRLEGIPLAIELASARVRMMAVEQIAARLDNILHFLRMSRGGGLPRHQTLQAAIDWSYNLLSEKEKKLLCFLSVFSGSFTLEAAEQVVDFHYQGEDIPASEGLPTEEVLDLLSHLIDKSLVGVVAHEQIGVVRYHLLETVRQYALDKLSQAGKLETTRYQHAHYFMELVEETEPELRGAEQEKSLSRIAAELDNLRTALSWASSRGEDGVEVGLRLTGALWQFWDVRGDFTEGRRWLEQFLTKPGATAEVRAKALRGSGALAWGQGDYVAARARLSESLALRRELGNQRDIAIGLYNLGILNSTEGDYAQARTLLEESLGIFRGLDNRLGIANVLNSLGVITSDLGDFPAATAFLKESLAIRKELGDKRGLANALGNLGVLAYRQGNDASAHPILLETLEAYRDIGDKRGTAVTLRALGGVAQRRGDYSLAYSQFNESLALWKELGNKDGIASCLEGLAGVACGWGACERAAILLGAADALRIALGSSLSPADQPHYERILAGVLARLGEEKTAAARAEGQSMRLEQALELAVSMEEGTARGDI